MSNNITDKEIDAIKFYLGDKTIVEQLVYRGGGKAYNTINALLNLGTRNEEDKAKENKTVEIYDVEHLKSYIDLIIDVFSASLSIALLRSYWNCSSFFRWLFSTCRS